MCNKGENKPCFGNFKLQKLRCLWSETQSVGTRFLIRTSGTFPRPKLSRFGEIFCFATTPHHLQQLHSRNAAKYHQKVWVIKQLFHACLWYSQTITPQSMAPRGNSFDYTTNKHEIMVYYFDVMKCIQKASSVSLTLFVTILKFSLTHYAKFVIFYKVFATNVYTH